MTIIDILIDANCLKNKQRNMIPKIIHYCWFGRGEMPELVQTCIASWHTHMPNWEFKLWSEDNFDIASAPQYVREAYEAKKYAFVSDYVRLWALEQEGGLYMDVDFEVYPEEHCVKAPELLAEINAPAEMIHAVCSHAYGMCCDVEPTHLMEKVMFAVDELTGLIGAAARMRPSKSVSDMELSSLKKKFKDKKFAAGCSRDVIKAGADRLGWTLDETLDKTIQAMRSLSGEIEI